MNTDKEIEKISERIGRRKSSWTSPNLTRFGQVRGLTLGSGPGNADGGSTMTPGNMGNGGKPKKPKKN